MIRPFLILATLAASPTTAQLRFQDTTAIDIAVAAFTGRRVGEEGGARAAVDPRLKLAACTLPQLDWRGTYQDAVVVTCDAPRWRIYVPIRLAPQAIRTPTAAPATPVAPTTPVIRRGDPITVEVDAGGFSITREGVAMGDATAGARLLVKVDPLKPPIQAVAVETGRATLPGWTR